jgi:S1-C subfamily serine protease
MHNPSLLHRVSFSVVLLLGIVFCCFSTASGQDINTLLMNSTFKISGSAEKGGTSTGTVFILGKPLKEDPKKGSYILITAGHVLDEIIAEDATLEMRRKNSDGTFTADPITLKIRRLGLPLYTKHPSADVAAMYVELPTDVAIDLLPTSFLADDDRISALEVHPGDELLCLGFPLAIDFNAFPVIRSGLLASYPLTPTRAVKSFYYNFHVFPGNSGGPVYFAFANRVFAGGTHIGIEQGIIGLVTQQLSSNLPGYQAAQLDIAVIVPSSFILDTIALLPAK